MNEFKRSLARNAVCNFVGFNQKNPALDIGPNTDRAKNQAEELALSDAELAVPVEVSPFTHIDHQVTLPVNDFDLHYNHTMVRKPPGNIQIGFLYKERVEVTNTELIPLSEGDYGNGRQRRESSRPLEPFRIVASSFFFVFLFILSSPWVAMAQSDQTYDPEARLAALGIKLPAPPSPVANYVNGVRTGNLIFLAGKGPMQVDGFELRGKLGKDLTIEQGYAGARQTAINQLAVLKAMLGNLNRVERVVKVLGMVNSDPSFVEQPAVINGFSDLIVEVFGERGRHARAAVGMASLPRGQAVEIEMIVEVAEVGAASESLSTPIRFKYFGAAGWEISDGKVVVLIDPYISRLKYGGGGNPKDRRPAYARNEVPQSDTALIDKLITRADFILVHHSHFDHLGDVPYIAKKTGAKVIGTETTTTILRAYGIPGDQLYTVSGGEDYQFEKFSIRVIPSIHSALNEKLYHDSRRYNRDTELKVPFRINQFIEGGSLMFLARFDKRTVLTMGSMNFIEREIKDIHPDILLAGVNGSRLGLYKYDERLLKVTGYPSIVIPTHWDNFRLPYGFSQEANRTRNLLPFIRTVNSISPKTRVIPPTHLKTIVID